jgi:lysophospholipase L1-like esterase
MIRNYADKNNIIYVDYFSAMADDKNGMKKELTHDGVHPTAAGYDVMQPIIEKAIKKALNKWNFLIH